MHNRDLRNCPNAPLAHLVGDLIAHHIGGDQTGVLQVAQETRDGVRLQSKEACQIPVGGVAVAVGLLQKCHDAKKQLGIWPQILGEKHVGWDHCPKCRFPLIHGRHLPQPVTGAPWACI